MFLALLALLACAPKVEPAPAPVLAVLDSAPTPYTAEQIRDAFPAGTQVRFTLTMPDGATMISAMEFTAVDAEGATYRHAMLTASGEELSPPEESRAAWTELRDHAKFPLESTRVEEVSVTTALGTFDAWLYTVQADEEGFGPTTQRYWFAKEMPGPPVLLTVEAGGAEVQRMEMIERK